MPTLARTLAALLLAAVAAPAAAADSWTRTGDVGSDPVTRTERERFDLGATGRVDVREIGGDVRVTAGAGDRVELVYERRAATQRDLDCETLRHELKAGELRIWLEHKKERACRVVRVDDTLTLTVPRGAAVSVRAIGDEVTVDGVEGLVRLAAIGDSATVTGAQQLEADAIGDTLKVSVARLGPAGIRISSIGDTVELSLPEDVDARLRVGSVGDEIRMAGLRLDDDETDYEAVLGDGGPVIQIDSVGDSVVIRGPRAPR